MTSEKKYDLLERTAVYAERVRDYAMKLPKNAANPVYVSATNKGWQFSGLNLY